MIISVRLIRFVTYSTCRKIYWLCMHMPLIAKDAERQKTAQNFPGRPCWDPYIRTKLCFRDRFPGSQWDRATCCAALQGGLYLSKSGTNSMSWTDSKSINNDKYSIWDVASQANTNEPQASSIWNTSGVQNLLAGNWKCQMTTIDHSASSDGTEARVWCTSPFPLKHAFLSPQSYHSIA